MFKDTIKSILAWPERVHLILVVSAIVAIVVLTISMSTPNTATLIMVAVLGLISGIHLVGTTLCKEIRKH